MLRPTICFLLLLITLAVFSQVRHHDYVEYDDPDYVPKNPMVQRGLTWDGVKWAFTTGHMSNWHPITWLSHMLDCEIYGNKPGRHHITSVLFHAANALLLFLVLVKMTGAIWRSAFVAGLFALHPLHVESVAWIAERKDVLSTFFGLLTLWSYTTYAQSKSEIPNLKTKKTSLYILTLFLFSFSLMSKPMLVTLPFALLLLDFWPLKRFSNFKSQISNPSNKSDIRPVPKSIRSHPAKTKTHGTNQNVGTSSPSLGGEGQGEISPKNSRIEPLNRRGDVSSPEEGDEDVPSPVRGEGEPKLSALTSLSFPSSSAIKIYSTLFPLILEKIPFLLLAILSSIVTFKVQVGKTVQSLENFSILDRISNVLVTYVIYISKTIWPAKLAFFYPLVKAPPLWQAALAALFLLSATILILRFARNVPYAFTGWFWYLGTLVPVIGLVHVGEQSHADRYTYIPSIGLFLIIAWGVPQLFARWSPKKILAVPAATVLIIFSVLTWTQVGYWKNNRVMLERALAVTKENFVALNNYGVALADEGKYTEAIDCYTNAIRIKPFYARAYDNYGSSLTMLGKFDEAAEKFSKALQYRPEARTHHNFAVTLARQKKYDQTILHCREALRLNPNYTDAYYDLALALHLSGQSEEAIIEFEKSLQANPADAPAHHHLAAALTKQKRFTEAISHYREAIRLQPDMVNAYTTLAWLLATHQTAEVRNGPEAVNLAETADRLTHHQQPYTISVLAAAYAESGQFDKAIQNAQEALALAEKLNRPEFSNAIRQQLQLYQTGKPCRTP